MPVEAVSPEAEAEAEAEPETEADADADDEPDEEHPTIDKAKTDANTADKILYKFLTILMSKQAWVK